MGKAFGGQAITTKRLSISRFWSASHVTVTYWEGSRVDEYIFQWRPNLISRSEYVTVFSATADGITFSRATKTGKLRLILSWLTLQYVMIPKLLQAKGNVSSAQSLKAQGKRKKKKKESDLLCLCNILAPFRTNSDLPVLTVIASQWQKHLGEISGDF